MNTKDQYLQIRVSPAEKAAIKGAASRAGMDMSRWVLEALFPAQQLALAGLFQELLADPGNRRFILAEISDRLVQFDMNDFQQVFPELPAGLDPYVANYVAAMVETAAHQKRLPPPAWTAAISPLPEPVFGSTLPGLRLHLLTQSPPAFRRRNIFIDSTVGDRV